MCILCFGFYYYVLINLGNDVIIIIDLDGDGDVLYGIYIIFVDMLGYFEVEC